jgi:hypothetical protein
MDLVESASNVTTPLDLDLSSIQTNVVLSTALSINCNVSSI